ncbi:MAG: hypothetical protein V4632_21825 [Pseudomonadota bacterium]
MPSHDTLHWIAGSYIPLLALLMLVLLASAFLRRDRRLARLRVLSVVAVLSIAWGFMLIDLCFDLFSAFGHDYSTHTAVALALVAVIARAVPRLAIMLASSFFAYLLLMLYQGYHTIPDMGITAVLVGIPAWALLLNLQRFYPSNQ